MFAIAILPGNRLLRLRFDHENLDFEPERHIAWVFEDYDARRDEQWRVPQPLGQGYVLKHLILAEQAGGDVLSPIRALGYYCAGRLTAFVIPHLSATDERERLISTLALGSMGHKAATPALVPQLQDPEPLLRDATALALSKFIDDESRDALAAAEAREPHLVEVTRTGDERRAALYRDDYNELVRVMIRDDLHYEDLAAYGSYTKDAVVRMLRDPELPPRERQRAIKMAGLARVTKPMDDVAEVLCAEGTSESLRIECVRYMSRVQARGYVPLLCAMLPDASPTLRAELIDALGWIGEPSATGALLNEYDSDGGMHNQRIQTALYRLGKSPSAVEIEEWSAGTVAWDAHSVYLFDGDRLVMTLDRALLAPALASLDPVQRREGYVLMGLTGDARDSADLSRAADTEPDPACQRAAARAALLVRDRGSSSP
jgi:hypothetical protein